MNRLFGILLILVLALPSLAKLCIYIDFKIDQDYIANNLCINIDKPELMCSGKCYLNKALNIDSQQTPATIPSELLAKISLPFILDVFYLSLLDKTSSEQYIRNLWVYQSYHSSNYFDEVYHPPQFHF